MLTHIINANKFIAFVLRREIEIFVQAFTVVENNVSVAPTNLKFPHMNFCALLQLEKQFGRQCVEFASTAYVEAKNYKLHTKSECFKTRYAK